MNRSLLVAALLAVALSACSKKEEATTAPAPAVAPTQPSAAEPAPEQAKPADAAPLNALPEQKPAAESKPAN